MYMIITMPKSKYECICCDYATHMKGDMRRHLYKSIPCPKIKNDIDLTDDIREYILKNRIYRIPAPDKSGMTEELQKLKVENAFLRGRKKESFYQHIVEEYLGGTHLKVEDGITDVTTDEIHAEIKEWSSYKNVVGQLKYYNLCAPRKKLQAYLFGTYPKSKQQHALSLFKTQNIEPYTFLEQGNFVYICEAETGKIVFTYNVPVSSDVE